MQSNGLLPDEKAAMDCLEAVAQDSTFWSAVYNNTNATVELTRHGKYEKSYRFDLEQW